MNFLQTFLMQSAVWGCLVTILAYALGTFLNRKTGKAVLNPLLLSSVFVIVFLKMLQLPYAEYKASASPVSYLLLPATISLALPLYEKWQLLRQNFAAILAGLLAGVMTSLGSIFAIAYILKLTHAQYVTLLPKSVTTAIGMDVASELGGMAVLAGAVIILTGIAGNLMAEKLCQLFHIRHAISRGIGIGSASHAIGTAKAMEMGDVEGAMSSLAIAAAGILTAFIAPLFSSLL